MLLFNEVTGGRALPHGMLSSLGRGNWVIPPSMGAMAIDSKIFIGKYINSQLVPLNRKLDVTATDRDGHFADFKCGSQPDLPYDMIRHHEEQWEFYHWSQGHDSNDKDRL